MKYIIANWKCNPGSAKEAKKLLAGTAKAARGARGIKVIVCPPFCYLDIAAAVLKKSAKLGAQNCFWQEGAFTGEVSALQIKDAKCEYAIIGHSERRKIFGETNELTNKKIKSSLSAGLIPILCVGETREERVAGSITQPIETQIKEGLADIPPADAGKVIIAYEPVWAIGTGQACSVLEANYVRQFINNLLGEAIPVLYGGSVNADNAISYMNDAKFNGLLVGGVSLKPVEFSQLLANVSAKPKKHQ
jgi:triosephosphate isomerase